uniref:Viral late gene transcription factor 3 zinc ribbon domain-containing protein n=1 Tax=Glycine max TaxID=3847 RepID=A0A0R0L3D7_SOYBN
MNGLGQLVTVPWKQQQRRTELSRDSKKDKNARRRRVGAVPVNVDDVTTVLDPAPVQVTWQIVKENGVPKLGFDFVCLNFAAGVTPFVVAGIEFSKRIIAQKRCEVCGGSGLVLREKEKDYLRCPECGGFLPWQSLKRFFSC